MKRQIFVVFSILLILTLSACSEEGRYQVILITEGNHTIGESTVGDLIIFGGEVILPLDVRLDGSAHIISGKFILDGEISGDISLLGGELTLGTQARIGGDLNRGGGELSGLSQNTVAGQYNTGSGIQLPSMPEVQQQNPAGKAARWVFNAVLVGIFALLLIRYFPRQVGHIIEATFQHSIVSLAMGVLVGIVGTSLLVLLAYTILLIPVALLGLAILVLAIVYSWAAYGIVLGRFISRYVKRDIPPGWVAFGGAFMFTLLFNVVTAIPIVGDIVGILVSLAGLGAVFLTRLGMHRFVPEAADNYSD